MTSVSTRHAEAIMASRPTAAAPRRVSDVPAWQIAEAAEAVPVATEASPKISGVSQAVAPRPSTLQDALDAYVKEARMTPRERIRRDVLKENRLTEEGLDAMEPKEREATEKKIKSEVDRRLALIQEEARRRGKQVGLPSL